MFESENRKLSNQNRKIEIGIIEAEIRIEATQPTRRIVTALLHGVNTIIGCHWLIIITQLVYSGTVYLPNNRALLIVCQLHSTRFQYNDFSYVPITEFYQNVTKNSIMRIYDKNWPELIMWQRHFHSPRFVSWLYDRKAVFLFHESNNSVVPMHTVHLEQLPPQGWGMQIPNASDKSGEIIRVESMIFA